MVKVALLVELEARAGREAEVEALLRDAQASVEQEPGTTVWFAVRFGQSSFGIFDAFEDESARDAHLSGRVASALMSRADDLFIRPPAIERLDVLAAKLPRSAQGVGQA